jgi:tRNA pseudouridine55 synthase
MDHLKNNTTNNNNKETNKPNNEEIPRYLNQGLFAVTKPLDWTSQDVVGFLRKMLERDAKQRGCVDDRKKKRNPWLKVGHGGTLDPLATGVLVLGVGKGTKELQKYLTGSKGYRAGVQLGFQTTTLDMDPTGTVVEEKNCEHVTMEDIEKVVPQFTGAIQQIPPVFR